MADVPCRNDSGPGKPLKLVLLEDSPLDAALILKLLADGGFNCQCLRVQTEEEFRDALETTWPDVILADYSLPQFDGLLALTIAVTSCPDVPFLFVSGMIGEERAIEGLKNGATDYVLKHHLDRLVPAVRRALREAEERTRRKRLEIELRQRVEQLAEIDRKKNQFLAVLSHELRNPLAPIRYALPLLKAACTNDPDGAEAYAVVDRQVRQMAVLIDDLLDVFRIIHQQIRLKKETLDLAALINDILKDRRGSVEEAGFELSVELPQQPLWVEGDQTRLYQVMSNLLANAVKFGKPRGQIAIQASQGQNGSHAVVKVRDDGAGIDASLLPHVFEMFTQGDDSITRRRGGLGLGLALVKGFIDQHGGQVTVASPGPNQGTEFTFSLPLSQNAGKPGPGAFTSPPGRRLNILVVEDSVDAARSLQILLKKAGHDVAVAYTGPDGLEMAKQIRPEVVLCDLGLPGMDGFEVARWLRAYEATASARIIAISGHGLEEDRRRSQEAGFDLHLVKPLDAQELIRLLGVLKLGGN